MFVCVHHCLCVVFWIKCHKEDTRCNNACLCLCVCAQAEEELGRAQKIFEELNVELQDELPVLWDR